MAAIREETGLLVVKRNGEVVPFDSTKIRDAITKAVIATQEKVEQGKIDKIAAEIKQELEVKFTDFFPNVENIQDRVENHLFKNDLYPIAKAYMLYREQRHESREKAKLENLEKSALGKLKVKKRDGRIVVFDKQKIRSTIARASYGYEKDINTNLIIDEAVKNLYDGATHTREGGGREQLDFSTSVLRVLT